MKRIISLTLSSLLFISCTPPSATPAEDKVSAKHTPPIPLPSPQPAVIHKDIKSVVASINNNQITLDDGLEIIQGFVTKELSQDRHADNGAADSDEPSESMQDLADAVFSIQQGDKVQNLAKILIKESYAGLDEEDPTITSLSTIGSLFDLLKQQRGLISENLNSDEFLIYFLTLYKKSYNSSNDTVLSDAKTFEKVKGYFAERCRINLENSSSNQGITETFKVFSGLLEVADLPEWLTELFNDHLDQIEAGSLKARPSTAYMQILKNMISSEAKFSAKMLSSSLVIAKKQISRIQFSNAFDSDVIDTLETAILLFDLPMDKYTVNSFPEWAELLDQKIYTLQSFEINIRNSINAKKIKVSDLFIFRHPYLQTYLNRAKNTKASKPSSVPFHFSPYLQNFSISLANAGSSVRIDLELLLKAQNAPAESTFNSTITAESVSKLAFEERAAKYRDLLTAVDVGRRYLEETLSFQFLQNTQLDRRDPKRVIYQSLKSIMVDALCYRFAEHIQKNGYACDSYKNPSLSAYQKNQNYQTVDSVNNEVDGTNQVQVIKYPRLTPIGAGIYVADTDMILEGNSLTFHPLSMIYAPGKNITLKADQVYGPWIDVSADDMPAVNKAPPSGEMPFFHTTRGMKNSTSFGGFSQCVFDGGDHPGHVVSYQYNERLFSDIFDYFPGSAPAKPEDALPGKSAGTVEIKPYSKNLSVKTSLSNILLVAMGGNGQPGYQGGDSPLCTNKSYKTFEGGYCVAGEPFTREGYSMQNKHKKPHIPNMQFVDGGTGQYGLSSFLITKVMYIVNISAGPGGDGGTGGSGGHITSEMMPAANAVALTMPGIEGQAGPGGSCGSGSVVNGTMGSTGQNGSVSFGN